MTLHPGSTPHINAYHLNSHLLFQFILAEFLEAFEEIQKLDTTCCRRPNQVDAHNTFSLQSQEIRQQIATILEKLAGSPCEYMRLFSWNFREGLLPKLKTYCSLFLKSSDSDEKDLITMQHYTEKIWLGCMQAVDCLRDEPIERSLFLSAIEKASNAMHRLSKLIARLILQFRDEENVIFFLLQHRTRFDKLYGNRFTFKLLTRMFPKGLHEVKQFLSKRYTDRGFDNIVLTILSKLTHLEEACL